MKIQDIVHIRMLVPDINQMLADGYLVIENGKIRWGDKNPVMKLSDDGMSIEWSKGTIKP